MLLFVIRNTSNSSCYSVDGGMSVAPQLFGMLLLSGVFVAQQVFGLLLCRWDACCSQVGCLVCCCSMGVVLANILSDD